MRLATIGALISGVILGGYAVLLLFGLDSSMQKQHVLDLTNAAERTNRQILVTDGIKHSVPLDEIRSGGPAKDGIPPIDKPKFINANDAAQWLRGDEPGIAFSQGATRRFYPYQILVWHEIVNDVVEGMRILVTYCPLCFSGFVFDPLVQGERVEFGTSGKLWKSNLVLYDRKTDSLWSQILGEAIVGEMTGSRLPLLPSDLVRFADWKTANPNGEVLSRDTGADRFYGSNPYGDYYTALDFSQSMAESRDTRLPPNAVVYGIRIGERYKAYSVEQVKVSGSVQDIFEDRNFVLNYENGLNVVRMYEKDADEKLQRINPFISFWFSWAAAHPETELYFNENFE